MRGSAALLWIVALLALVAGAPSAGAKDPRPRTSTAHPLNTLDDLQNAIKKCWISPALADVKTGMDITIMLTFTRTGEIFGGRVIYESPNVSKQERAVYLAALAGMLRRCSRLPFSDSFGNAVAGRPFRFLFSDHRKERKA
jgi:hypothetical protein